MFNSYNIFVDGCVDVGRNLSGVGGVFYNRATPDQVNFFSQPSNSLKSDRVEIEAIVVGLNNLPEASHVDVYTDQKYLVGHGTINIENDKLTALYNAINRHQQVNFIYSGQLDDPMSEMAHGYAQQAAYYHGQNEVELY